MVQIMSSNETEKSVQMGRQNKGKRARKTGSRKEAKNIQVVSVIDRYLEHSRIISFHHGGSPLLFISSADWMTRNLDKRVELMVPIEDKENKKRLLQILDTAFKDNCNSYEILPDGSSKQTQHAKGKKRFRMQEHLQKQATKAARARSHERSTTFEPHRPS